MIYPEQKQRFAGFAAAQSEIDGWCDNKFPGQPDLIARCKGGLALIPPWTAAGALMRGIPWHGADVGSAINPGASTDSPLYPGQQPAEGLFGVSKGVLYGGLAILGLGAAVALGGGRRKGRK